MQRKEIKILDLNKLPQVNINPYHAKGYLRLVPNYAKCNYSHDQSKCSTMPSVTIVV